MSVRRLAEKQPPSFAFTPENLQWAKAKIAQYPEGRQQSAVIPILWKAQEQCGGWLPQKAIEATAELLGMAKIRVLEVATFYTMFNLSPVGRFHVQLCGTTPCMLRGAEELKKVCHHMIGHETEVTADGTFSWIEVECLGACVNAPMVQINADFYEDLTPDILTRIINDFSAGRTPQARPADRPGQFRADRRTDHADRSVDLRNRRDSRLPLVVHRFIRTRTRLMLADKDRIFKNLYGHHGFGLDAARARGAWDGTKEILGKGPRRHHQRGQGLRPARPRRRRLRHRLEMVVHAQTVGRAAALSRHQCRRIRARHLQGPRGDAARSASSHRGLSDRRLRHGGEPLLHLYPRRIHPRARARRSRSPAGL